FVDPLVGMRDQNLRVLLEHGGDRKRGDVARDRVEALQRVGAHEEVELADRQQEAVVYGRPARPHGEVKPPNGVGGCAPAPGGAGPPAGPGWWRRCAPPATEWVRREPLSSFWCAAAGP